MNKTNSSLTGIFLFLVFQVHAQHFTNLVLEGAGVRGIAYAGAIKYLEEEGRMNDIQNVAGTSAGAIAALAISLGYTSKEIDELIGNIKLQQFNDGKYFFIGGFLRMNQNYGWYRGRVFTKWLDEMIVAKTGNADITFQELHDHHYVDLYVTGTSLNHQRLVLFSHRTYPFMKVKDAVRISISIPLYFEAVIIDSVGHVLTKKDIRNKSKIAYRDVVVDGGIMGNFPITIFDPIRVEGKTMHRIPNPETIGIRTDTQEQIAYDSMGMGLAPIPISRFRNYLAAVYNYSLENLNRTCLTADDWSRTISVSSGNIGPRIRKLSPSEKDLLMSNGYLATKRFIMKNSITKK